MVELEAPRACKYRKRGCAFLEAEKRLLAEHEGECALRPVSCLLSAPECERKVRSGRRQHDSEGDSRHSGSSEDGDKVEDGKVRIDKVRKELQGDR